MTFGPLKAKVKSKRVFDLIAVLFSLFTLALPMMFLSILVRATSKGSALYWSNRMGKNNRIFRMPKFRTMKLETPAVATHLMSDPGEFLTIIGGFLRSTSLDELPQLFSILKGDMSFVGPRPALYNQDDLVALRTENGVYQLVPGLTGLAQVRGRDELPIPEKVALDLEYMQRQSLWFDIYILWLTVLKVLVRDGISH
jgi:O-antigen biosynthesis protein WbqP